MGNLRQDAAKVVLENEGTCYNTERIDTDVLLLSAGFGKRLRPLTDIRPKPLIEICGKTLVERNLELVSRAGLKRVFINLHYLGEQIRQHVGDGSRWGLEIIYVEEPIILDTGGAIKNIEPYLQHEDLLTVNSDIVLAPDFDLKRVVVAHRENILKPLITMVLRHDPNTRLYGAIGVNSDLRVVAFLNESYGLGPVVKELMFLGVQVISREAFSLMPPAGNAFSITRDTVKEILSKKGVICGYLYDGFWSDVGTPERLISASKELSIILGIPSNKSQSL